MNTLGIPDSKIYKLGIATLVEHLGRDETTRFLSICKPREAPIEVSGQTLSHTEMKKIEKKIYKAHGTKPPASDTDLSQMSDITFYELALNIILDQLGPVGMMCFMRIRRPGTGDYTAEGHQWLDKLDRKTILEGIQEASQKRLDVLKKLTLLDASKEIMDSLSDNLINAGALPLKARVDSFHIAITAINNVEYLATWNFKHIANINKIPLIQQVCREAGYQPPILCTPQQLLMEDF